MQSEGDESVHLLPESVERCSGCEVVTALTLNVCSLFFCFFTIIALYSYYWPLKVESGALDKSA